MRTGRLGWGAVALAVAGGAAAAAVPCEPSRLDIVVTAALLGSGVLAALWGAAAWLRRRRDLRVLDVVAVPVVGVLAGLAGLLAAAAAALVGTAAHC